MHSPHGASLKTLPFTISLISLHFYTSIICKLFPYCFLISPVHSSLAKEICSSSFWKSLILISLQIYSNSLFLLLIKSITHLFHKSHAKPDRIVQTCLHGRIISLSFLFPIVSSHPTERIILTIIKINGIRKHLFWHYFLSINLLHNFCYFIIFCLILPSHNNNLMDA